MDKSFLYAPVSVPNLSGFDESFPNQLTTDVGTITPIMVAEVIPGSENVVDMALSAVLPPLASETFMHASLKVESFYVPFRLLFGGYEYFFTQEPYPSFSGIDDFSEATVKQLPYFDFVSAADLSGQIRESYEVFREAFGARSLSDYLGFCCSWSENLYLDSGDFADPSDTENSNPPVTDTRFSLMPYLAYAKIFNDWYRAPLIQKEVFARLSTLRPSDVDVLESRVSCCPYIYDDGPIFDRSLLNFVDTFGSNDFLVDSYFQLADGISIFSTRQRNFGFDFFTCATPTPTQGESPKVTFDTSGLEGGFSIATLRSINSLAQFKDRNNLTGPRYIDRLRGQYGVAPTDGVAQRTICLGSTEFEVYSRGVNDTGASGQASTQNPFSGILGSRGGQGIASSDGSVRIVNHFKASEQGYIFVMATLVPRVSYSMGVKEHMRRYVLPNSIGELANPILQNIGPEPIYVSELSDNPFDRTAFGFTDRYGHFKTRTGELHGLFREREDLGSFVAQRYFADGTQPQINSEFLEIPKTYLDNVTAVKADLSKYGVQIDSYFRYRCSMPLAKYSLPSLQDPAWEHGKILTVHRGGFRF